MALDFEADAFRDSIRADLTRAEEKLLRMQEVQNRISALEVHLENNGIKVVVDSGGYLKDLQITAMAMNSSPELLSQNTLHLITAAKKSLFEKMVVTTGEVMGFDDPMVHQLCIDTGIDFNEVVPQGYAPTDRGSNQSMEGLL